MKLLGLRRKALACASVIALAALAVLVWQRNGGSSPEREVRRYLCLAGSTPLRDAGKLASHFGPEHLPFVMAAFTNQNSAFREHLLRLEYKLANHVPDRAARWLIDATDRGGNPEFAFAALRVIASKPDGLEALAPSLRHPEQLMRYYTIGTLGSLAHEGNTRGLALLTQALSSESDPALRVRIAAHVLGTDRGNTNAAGVLHDMLTSTNSAASNIARQALKDLAPRP